MGTGIWTVKLLSILIYIRILRPLVHQVNRLVSFNVLLGAIVNVYFSEVLAVVAFGLGQHPPLLVVLETLLQFVRVFEEANLSVWFFLALRKVTNAVTLPNDASHSIIVVSIVLFVFIFIEIIIEKFSSFSMQEISLLFRWQTVKVNILILFIIVVSITSLVILRGVLLLNIANYS